MIHSVVFIKRRTLASRDIIAIHKPAAPIPQTTLPNIRIFAEGESAQMRLPTSKRKIEIRYTILAGAIVKIFPQRSIKPACIENIG